MTDRFTTASSRLAAPLGDLRGRLLDGFGRAVDALEANIGKAPADMAARRAQGRRGGAGAADADHGGPGARRAGVPGPLAPALTQRLNASAG